MVFNSIWDTIKAVGQFIIDTFKNVGKAVKAVLTGDFSALTGIFQEQVSLMNRNFSETVQDLGGKFKGFTENVKQNFSDAVDAVTKRKKIEFIKENVDASAIKDKVKEAVQSGIKEGSSGGRGAVSGVSSLSAEGIIQAESPLKKISEEMPVQVANISDQQEQFMANAVAFNEGLTEIVNQTTTNFVGGFAEMIGGLAAGTASVSDISKLLLGTLGDMAIQVGKMAIGIGLAVDGIKKALMSLNPVVAIAAGVALVALGSFAKSALSGLGKGGGGSEIPKFADGGLVYGTTIGMMGEYSGARTNPEVIAPLDKLKGMLTDVVGGGSSKGEFTLRGQDLILALDRAGAYKNRRG